MEVKLACLNCGSTETLNPSCLAHMVLTSVTCQPFNNNQAAAQFPAVGGMSPSNCVVLQKHKYDDLVSSLKDMLILMADRKTSMDGSLLACMKAEKVLAEITGG